MFLYALKPSSEVRLISKIRRFDDKVFKTYLEIGKLCDDLGEAVRNTSQVYSALVRSHKVMEGILKSLDSHADDSFFFGRSYAFEQASKDYKLDYHVHFRAWQDAAMNLHEVELKIIELSQKIIHERDVLLTIRDDAIHLYEEVCGIESLEILNDVIQAGSLLRYKHSYEVERSDEHAGVR